VLIASQVAAGEENALKIRIYGEHGGLEWAQMEPNTLLIKWLDKPAEIYRAGQPYLSNFAKHNTRTPGGHPEGYLEAFANIYRNFAQSLMCKMQGKEPSAEMLDYPRVEEGVRGMAFIDNVVASSQSEKKWTDFTL
jgi:predicted dehydrogenase